MYEGNSKDSPRYGASLRGQAWGVGRVPPPDVQETSCSVWELCSSSLLSSFILCHQSSLEHFSEGFPDQLWSILSNKEADNVVDCPVHGTREGHIGGWNVPYGPASGGIAYTQHPSSRKATTLNRMV